VEGTRIPTGKGAEGVKFCCCCVDDDCEISIERREEATGG